MNYIYSPYSYAKLNPVLFEDLFGLYPRITIDGTTNTITISSTYYFVSANDDPNKGLSEEQKLALEALKNSIAEWSGTFEKDNKKYEIKIDVSFEKVDGQSYDMMAGEKASGNLEGVNFIRNVEELATNEPNNQGIGHERNGELMEITRNFSIYKTTGAHEFGHCLGLPDLKSNPDPTVIPSIMQPVDIVNGVDVRNNPSPLDRQQVYETLISNDRIKQNKK